jgi:hypothetical protein
MADEVAGLLMDEPAAVALGRAGRLRAVEHDWSLARGRMVSVYRRALASG